VGARIAGGKLRAWGLLNWPAELLAEARRSAAAQGVPAPAAVQLPYSRVRRSPVEDPDVAVARAVSGASVVASAVLAAGALSGKYARAGVGGAGPAARPRSRSRSRSPSHIRRSRASCSARLPPSRS
jgi:aryl-alcohol dehydrogenase-like predicted oxidoreductase